MNRNQESHFSRVPTMTHQRSSMDRSSGHTTSFNAGKLIPIYCEDVLPGDTVTMNTTVLARLQTMLTPVFGNIYLDTYWFFVPNRLIWSHWKEFMGENTQSAWIPSKEYSVPGLFPPRAFSKSGDNYTHVYHAKWPKGSIADYLGYNIINPQILDQDVNADGTFTKPVYNDGLPIALPTRAYGLIWNDFFRDQNLQDPIYVPTGDASDTMNVSAHSSVTPASPDDASIDPNVGAQWYMDNNIWQSSVKGLCPAPAAKFHDYFTSCLPQPQKGPAVSVPLNIVGQRIPVLAGPNHNNFIYNPNYDGTGNTKRITPLSFGYQVSPTASSGIGKWAQASVNFSSTPHSVAALDYTPVNDFPPASNDLLLTPSNLWAYFDKADAGIGINELRLATITQMYYEALARGGSRYEEQLQQFFGVSNPDSRIQHPEYLGGRRMQINVREVTNTAQSSNDFLGDLGAQSSTAGTNSDFTKSFTEHGWLMGFAVLRYDHSYNQGLPRKYSRFNKFDYYNPLFARIGEQPVYDREIYNDLNNSRNGTGESSPKVFGYQEAWASYRYAQDVVSGELRPNLDAGLGHWTLSDNYAVKPTLSSNWIVEDKDNLDRALAVTSTLSDQMFADFYFNCTWTRPMPMYSVPGAIGQF